MLLERLGIVGTQARQDVVRIRKGKQQVGPLGTLHLLGKAPVERRKVTDAERVDIRRQDENLIDERSQRRIEWRCCHRTALSCLIVARFAQFPISSASLMDPKPTF